MANRPRNALLLSATINPMPGLPALARTDPAQRLQDYARALSFYVQHLHKGTIDLIVFAENSLADLSELRALVDKAGVADRVEFVSFYGLDFPPTRGRGYGEFMLVEHAMEHSQRLNKGQGWVVWKCTGRYVIQNFDKLVRSRPASADLYCHCRNHPQKWCELYALAWTAEGYQRLIKGIHPKLANDMTPGVHTFEEVQFRGIIDAARGSLKLVQRFKVVPLIDAVRGWDNSKYSVKWYSPKILSRRVAGVVAPWLWI